MDDQKPELVKNPDNLADPRHQARQIALAMLFEWSFNEERNSHELFAHSREVLATNDFPSERPLQIFNGVRDNLSTINKIILAAAPSWPLEQIARLDLMCLRLAVYELYFSQGVPYKVAINEAVDLAKEFGGLNSGKFVNGVLGSVVRTLLP